MPERGQETAREVSIHRIRKRAFRRLLVFDVEGTLFANNVNLPGTSLRSTIWQGIAHKLGPDAVREEVATHGRWKRGEYRGYLDWMADTIEIHLKYGLTRPVFDAIIAEARYNPGVAAALDALDRSKYEPVLISGGFRALGERVQRDFAVRHLFAACDYIFGETDALVGYNLLPCDFDGKLDFIRLMLREYQLQDNDWVFVGDGANDVAIARQAPLSIGYRPDPELEAVVTTAISSFEELPNLLDSMA